MLEVIKCGTKVIENISNTYGEITCVSIRFSNLQYEKDHPTLIIDHCI